MVSTRSRLRTGASYAAEALLPHPRDARPRGRIWTKPPLRRCATNGPSNSPRLDTSDDGRVRVRVKRRECVTRRRSRSRVRATAATLVSARAGATKVSAQAGRSRGRGRGPANQSAPPRIRVQGSFEGRQRDRAWRQAPRTLGLPGASHSASLSHMKIKMIVCLATAALTGLGSRRTRAAGWNPNCAPRFATARPGEDRGRNACHGRA